MTGAQRRAWTIEFDRRLKAGRPTKRMNWREVQIQDDKGDWYRRNGDACCGCGRNRQAHDDGDHNRAPQWKPIPTGPWEKR